MGNENENLNGLNQNEEKNLKNSYFKLINKTMKERFEKNKKDVFGLRYCLYPKDFKRSFINPRMSIGQTYYIIPWKTYLMRKLLIEKEEHGSIWAQNLHNFLSSESFPNQNKYQNMFFYQEYEILTKHCKQDQNEDDSEEDKSDPYTSIRERISNNLMASFVSADSMSPHNSLRDDPNYEYQFNKLKIKEYMEIFKQHISLKEHPINIIITAFIKEFVPFVNDVIEFYNNNNDNKIGFKEKAEDIITQLQEFIVVMQTVIKLFYSKSISYTYFKDEKDEFLNLISYIIFNSDKIYQKFFRLFEIMNQEKIELLNKKFELFGEMQPEEFGIKDKFCLNDKTRTYMEDLKKEKKNSRKKYQKKSENDDDKEKDKDKDKVDDDDDENKLSLKINGKENEVILEENIEDNINIKEAIKEKIINKDDDDDNNENIIKTDTNIISTNNDIHEPIRITSESGKLSLFTKQFARLSNLKGYNKEPYGQAIEFLKAINEFKVPLEKLIIIASISSLITECVNKYWKDMEKFIKPSMLSIDADELMTIFIYIVYKCKMPSLFVHADFINYFTSPTTKSTMIGYYYTTLRGCLDFLIEVKDKLEFVKESI